MSAVPFDKVVPFGQDFVFDDMLVTFTFKEWVTFFLCLIDSSVDRCEYSESRFGSRFGRHFTGLLNGVEHGTAPDSGNLREEPVLDGIPLGAVGRVVCNPDVDTQFLRGLDEAPFELPAPCVVRSASVAEDEDAFGTWIYVSEVLLPLLHETVTCELGGIVAQPEGHVARIPRDIVDAVGHHLAVGERGVVMVIHLHWLSGVCTAVVPPVRAKQLLLLGVHAEYGNAISLTFPSQLLNLPELLITQFAVCHRQSLDRLAAGISFSLDDLPDSVEAYLCMVLLGEYQLYLRGREAEPLRIGFLRKPRYVKRYYLAEDCDVLGVRGEYTLPASSLLPDSTLFEVFTGAKFTTTSVDGVTRNVKDVAHKAYAVYAIPFCNDGDELPPLPFARFFEVLHFLVCHYICWIFRDIHNCLEFSCNVTKFLADLKIYNVNNQKVI